MTPLERNLIAALSRCRLAPGTFAKRYAREMESRASREPETLLSPKQRRTLAKLVVQYRRQIHDGELIAAAEVEAMDAEGWERSADPRLMLEVLMPGRATPPHLSPRKVRLFAVACCRLEWSPLSIEADTRYAAQEAAEKYAEGTDRHDAVLALHRAEVRHYPEDCACVPDVELWTGAMGLATLKGRGPRRKQADLLRCIAGNPFIPSLVLQDGDRTPTVLAIARECYASRDFSCLGVLADALQDAGCEERSLLGHLRSGTQHARGCWAVDLILGKG